MTAHSSVADSALIVLAAGTVTQDFVSIMNATTPALLPYMGRPLIYQIIVNHIKKYGQDVVIAIADSEPRLEDFLQASFGNRVNLTIVRIPKTEKGSPTTSLATVLAEYTSRAPGNKPAFILYGDIYFEAPPMDGSARPVAFVDTYIESDKYSYFQTEKGRVTHTRHGKKPIREDQKPEARPLTDIGAYWVPSLADLQQKIKAGGDALDTIIGGLLVQLYPDTLTCKPATAWSDLGHLDTATQIHTRLIGTREFNALTIDEERGLITKQSRNPEKILQEINYYHKLPRPLSIYFPRLHDFKLGREISYTTEFYSYRSLAEYFVFFNFPVSVWKKILTRILAVQREFSAYSGEKAAPEKVYDFYVGKLESRMAEITPASPIHALVQAAEVTVNGQRLKGWQHYRSHIQEAVRKLATNCTTSIVHGDLCFSNILYDPQTSLVKFIDPRGDFFAEGCYGDPRYDLAKLLHSFHGGYDYIMQEMYEIHAAEDNSYRFRLFQSPEASAAHLLAWMKDQTPYDMQELLLLEALLFLSMLPLHTEDPDRQKALYLTGITILHEVFGAAVH